MHELLADHGTIFISIDDNEIHRLRMLMDEIFGIGQFSAQITVLVNPKGRGLSAGFADTHEYVLVYQKADGDNDFSQAKVDEQIERDYPSVDSEGLRYRTLELRNTHRQFGRHNRQKLWFPLWVDPKENTISLSQFPEGIEVWPRWDDGYEGCWTWNKAKVILDNHLLVGRKVGERWKVFRIDKADGSRSKATTVWIDADVQSEKGQDAYEEIMGERFSHPPKSVRLIEKIVQIGADPDALILDCFAGTGTTGHAVMAANAADGGNRRFILIEGEVYADKTTAERVRRLITGYSFEGTKSEVLLRKNITWSVLKNASQLIAKMAEIEATNATVFKAIKKSVKDGVLTLVGESVTEESVEGLGGTFTYCALGPELNVEAILTGTDMPDYLAVAAWLFHTATGESFNPDQTRPDDFFVGESSAYTVWLVYRPDLDFLKSANAALTAPLAEAIAASRAPGKKHLVFAPAKYIPNHKLQPMGIEYAPLPFALYRIEKS